MPVRRSLVAPMQSCYLLQAYDRQTLSLFDYSMTPAVDGSILLQPERFDLNRLEFNDPCR